MILLGKLNHRSYNTIVYKGNKPTTSFFQAFVKDSKDQGIGVLASQYLFFAILYVQISDDYPEMMNHSLESPTFYECYLKGKAQSVVNVISTN